MPEMTEGVIGTISGSGHPSAYLRVTGTRAHRGEGRLDAFVRERLVNSESIYQDRDPYNQDRYP
jgi:hypothetical protein